MRILIISFLLLALTGCCTTCFKKDINKFVKEEKQNVPAFHLALKSLTKSRNTDTGAFQDLVSEFKKERVDTTDIGKDISDIFCPSP